MRLPDGWLFTPRQDKTDRMKIVIEQTEIVRCKNCRHYNTTCCGYGYGWCENRNFGTNDEWYCADGEAGTYELPEPPDV